MNFVHTSRDYPLLELSNLLSGLYEFSRRRKTCANERNASLLASYKASAAKFRKSSALLRYRNAITTFIEKDVYFLRFTSFRVYFSKFYTASTFLVLNDSRALRM